MVCVTSAFFSINVNGNVHGFFNGKCGLRKGDPLSPYLFTLVMEVLTLILQRRVRLADIFHYHPHCESLQLINVCFTDDLFMFCRGELQLAKLIMGALEEFKTISGLFPSIPKSTVFFCGVSNHIKTAILNIMPFQEEKLPVKYLGIPLISYRLLNKDCKSLVEKVQNRIGDWKNKSLSFAGRLQLCQYVISSMHVYWASVLVIPVGIIHDIEQLMRGFLWCNGELKKGRAKVTLADICLPKRKGGQVQALGKNNMGSPTKKEVYSLWNCVAGLISNITWTWPQGWLNKAPDIGNIANIQLADQDDELQWRDSSGKIGSFSVKGEWEALRTRGLDVAWYNIVWFTHAIPQNSFHLWLVMRNSLKTQDLLRSWDVGPIVDLASLRCLLCDRQRDSHNHLFFECKFSARVWSYVRDLAELENVPPILTDIVEILHVTGKPKSARSIIGRLIVAATTYYIWKERNSRIFNKVNRTPEEIRDMITVTIRLKLLTFKFKNKTNVN
nr:hypothetical protein [Tanacetum cinerariifolium]